jgi:hypothetical protein
MILGTCMQWRMLSRYMEVMACKMDTVWSKTLRAMAREEVGKVQQAWNRNHCVLKIVHHGIKQSDPKRSQQGRSDVTQL